MGSLFLILAVVFQKSRGQKNGGALIEWHGLQLSGPSRSSEPVVARLPMGRAGNRATNSP
jgi:hypothetical protein